MAKHPRRRGGELSPTSHGRVGSRPSLAGGDPGLGGSRRRPCEGGRSRAGVGGSGESGEDGDGGGSEVGRPGGGGPCRLVAAMARCPVIAAVSPIRASRRSEVAAAINTAAIRSCSSDVGQRDDGEHGVGAAASYLLVEGDGAVAVCGGGD